MRSQSVRTNRTTTLVCVLKTINVALNAYERKRAFAVTPFGQFPVDYPEPLDAKEICAYCGRRTRGTGGQLHKSPYGDFLVEWKTACARAGCMDAAERDPNWVTRYPIG